jgi:hypothetical protein
MLYIDPILSSIVASTSSNVAPDPKKMEMEGNVADREKWTTKLLEKCALLLKDKIVKIFINEMKHQKTS